MHDSRSLFQGLQTYQSSLEKHCNNLKVEFEQLEARWKSFDSVAEGDYIKEFRLGWAKTQSQFKSYIDQAEAIIVLLDERMQSLSIFNSTGMEIHNGESVYSLSVSQTSPGDFIPPSSPQIEEELWGNEGAGEFNKDFVKCIPPGLKGLYHIYSSDDVQYLGKSSNCIRGRLKCHLNGSTNKKLRAAIESGKNFSVAYWESPDPEYEEALEIQRLKAAQLLKGQRNEKKPLIEGFDDDD
jgi:hypothetical protein